MTWKPKFCLLGTVVLLCTTVLLVGETPNSTQYDGKPPFAVDRSVVREGTLSADVAPEVAMPPEQALSAASPIDVDVLAGTGQETAAEVGWPPAKERGRTRANDTCPAGSIFAQNPNGSNTTNSDQGGGHQVYDDFANAGDIDVVTWWGINAFFDGSAWNPCTKDPEPFEISFWDDDGSGYPDLTAAVCSYTLTPSKVDTGEMFAATYPIYRYTAILPSTCTITSGWVSIFGLATGQDCWSLWHSSIDGDNRCVQWDYATGAWIADPTYDMSVCFEGAYVPTYGACCDDSMGVCVDNVELLDCPPPLRFAADTLCVDLVPTCGNILGACCDPDTSDCYPNKTQAECDALFGPGNWLEGVGCDPNPCPQANNNWENATPIGDVINLPFDTTHATPDGPGTCMYGPNIWFCYTASCTSQATWSLCGSSYDTKLAIYDTCGEPITYLRCNDDFCGLQSQISLPVIGGNEYLVEVGGYSSAAGPGVLSIWCDPDPTGVCCLGTACIDDEYQVVCESAGGTYGGDDTICSGEDCQPNGVDDFCDIVTGTSGDCNENGIPDECEALDDWDMNGVPDICDPDCNENGVVDACDITCLVGNCANHPGGCGGSEDCQPDGIPDECQLGGEAGEYVDVLCTTFAANGGHRGNMFDVTILAPEGITIESFDGHFAAGTAPASIEVWFRTDHGSYVGHNQDPTGWTLLGAVTLPTVNPQYEPTPVPIGGDEVFLQGETVGFYFTRTDGISLRYTNGPFPDFVNDDLIIHGGYGHSGEYPFNCPFNPRVWNGCIYYNYGGPGPGADCNANGIPDDCDIMYGTSMDCQPDEIPDECQLEGNDCQQDGIPDDCQLEGNDCNENEIPDECELPPLCPTCPDCQGDGIPDDCQLEDNDCNEDGIPDDCQLESNDWNGNGVPDDCEPDCNENGIVDACDITCLVGNCANHPGGCSGSEDCQPDGIPDECQLGGAAAPDGYVYLWDDGSGENGLGLTAGGEPAWINHFESVPGETTIGIIQTTFGVSAFPGGSGISPSDDVRLYVWDDPAGNGDATQAVLMGEWSGSVCADGSCIDSDQFQDFPIGPITVGDSFFVGVSVVHASGSHPMPMDGGPPISGESWVHFNAVAFDPNDMSGTLNLQSIGFAYNFMIRAVSGGAVVMGADCNGNGTPDDCDILHCPYNCLGELIFPEPMHCADCQPDGVPDGCQLSGGPPPIMTVDIYTDWYPSETTWILEEQGGPVIASGGPYYSYATHYITHHEIDVTKCYDFTIFDSYGDGQYPPFGYELSIDGNVVALTFGSGWVGTVQTESDLCPPPPPGADCNENLVPDECDIAGGSSLDCNEDGIPDECQLEGNDCNGNLIPDDCDTADCDGSGWCTDCNENGIPDGCEGLDDCDGDGMWDICDPDCDENGTSDVCDILWCDTSLPFEEHYWCLDCQPDGVPDGYQVGGPTGPEPCTDPDGIITVEILTDNYGSETTWVLIEQGVGTVASGGPYDSNTLYITDVPVCSTSCYDWTIFDSYGDGICCAWGEGYYRLVYEEIEWNGGEFGYEQTVTNIGEGCGTRGGARTLTYHVSVRASGANPEIVMFDESGAVIGSYEQHPCCATDPWGYRDGASDGEFVYFGCSNCIVRHDADGANAVQICGASGAPGGCSRALAFDNGTLWSASWGSELVQVDVTDCSQLNFFPGAGWSLYGLAYDATDGNLWGHDGGGTVIKIDSSTGTIMAGEGWPNGFPQGTAQGGLSGLRDGSGWLAAVMQGTPDLLGVYDLTGTIVIGPWDLDALTGEGGNLGVAVTGGGAGYIGGEDCNGNLIPDECDLMYCQPGELWCADCNEDEIPDGCQLEGNDCQGDGIPDDCQLYYAAPPAPPCADPDAIITVEILTDYWSYETSWDLEEHGVGVIASGSGYASQTFYSIDVDVCSANCYNFTIYDAYGDGIYSPGGYTVYYNGDVVASTMGSGWFGSSETVSDIGEGCEDLGIDNDCNENEIPDECDIPPLCQAGEPGFPEECSADCWPNGIPDECEEDCNENGVPDDCDMRDCPRQTEGDCEGWVLPGYAWCDDCNDNGIIDACDLGGGGGGGGGAAIITVTIFTDNYPSETTWDVAEQGGGIVGSGGPYTAPGTLNTHDVEVDSASCYNFTIYDSWGDGICCGYGNGYYEVYYEGDLVGSGGEFGSSETVYDIGGGCGGGDGDDCVYRLDDGSCENALGLTAGGEPVWIQHFWSVPGCETIDAVQTTFGCPGGGPSGVGPGDPVRVYLWDDPNGDALPTDALLWGEWSDTVDAACVETGVFQTIPIGPVTVGPSFFIGVSIVHAAGGYPMPMDTSVPLAHESWVHFNTVPFNPNDVAGALNLDAIGFSADWMLRAVRLPDPPPPENDCNTNGIPDECDLDCNGNDIPDDCEEVQVTCSAIEIKGDACPAPFNRTSRGVTPVDLFGDAFLDVTAIDLATIRMVRVDGEGGAAAPLEGPPGPASEIMDVGTPFYPTEPCECGANNAHDGILDVKMKFSTEEIVNELELVSRANGEIEEVVIIGNLCNGNPFMSSSYCLRFVPQGSGRTVNVTSTEWDAYVEVTPPDLTLDEGGFTSFERIYDDSTTVTLTAEPTFNGKVFGGWVVDGVPDTSGSMSISVVTYQEAMTVEATYVETLRLARPGTGTYANAAAGPAPG